MRRVAIVNRGEAAMRLIRAVQELRVERGRDLETVALYTEAERNAMFVREADLSVPIRSEGRAYLDHDAIERALVESGADAVWVGWGFVAEDPVFADRVAGLGLTFVGPSGETMRRLGDKIGAKLLAESAGVPVAEWSGGPVKDITEARDHAGVIGFPLMVKASAGGGGRGIRRVDSMEELAGAIESARREAAGAFGDDTVFMERVVTRGRHIEVQMVADGEGGVWAAGVRDCSIQRRHQKVIEESASTVLSSRAEQEARQAARALMLATGYQGAGTVEFLYEPEADRLAFLEVNTRLQVEHPVTEITTGLDLVKLQLWVAAGGRLEGDPPRARGHAIEVRLNAEDADRGFMPAPGRIERLAWPAGPGVRVETGVAEGDEIPPEYDSMIAKVIGYGLDREEARARVLRALRATTVVVRGGTTNKAFLVNLLEHPDVIAGRVDTAWLDELMSGGAYQPPSRAAIALIATAVDAYDDYRDSQQRRFYISVARGRPQTDMALGHRVDLRLGGGAYSVDVYGSGPRQYRLDAEGCWIDASVERLGPFERRLTVSGTSYRIISARHGVETLVEVDGLPHRVSQDDGGLVRAPSPGVVVDIAVSTGDEVEAGARLATLESMKMEVALRAPAAGRVKEVLASVGSPVDGGSPILKLEQEGGQAEAGDRSDLTPFCAVDPPDPRTATLAALADFQAVVLGYDRGRAQADASVRTYQRTRARVEPADREVVDAELRVLDSFADITALSRNRRIDPDLLAEEVHLPREFFHAFLQTFDTARAGLPASFEAKLRAAAARYQETVELDRTPELEETLFWVFLAQQRSAQQIPAVMAVLRYHLEHPEAPDGGRDRFLDTLDRLILATQVRHPVVGQLARSVRFRLFDAPVIEAERARVLEQMTGYLSSLVSTNDPAERDRLTAVLVGCPLPLIMLLAALDDDEESARRELIEIQSRRYYGPHGLGDLESTDQDGLRVTCGQFEWEGSPVVMIATSAAGSDTAQLAAALRAVVGAAGRRREQAVADVYVQRHGDADLSSDALAAAIAAAMEGLTLPPALERLTVSVPVGPDRLKRSTFVRAAQPGTLQEELLLRDLHPMIASRLDLWRFSSFDLVRLAGPEGVYVFGATAKTNPDDRRIIALAEIRDLTPLRDGHGAVIAIPAMEQVFDSCLEALRTATAHMEGAAPQWNRIVLFVWPVVDLGSDEMMSIVRSLAPRADGIGLEQVSVQARIRTSAGPESVRMRMSAASAAGLTVDITAPPTLPLQPLDAYGQKVLQARRRGAVYPYDLVPLLLRAPQGDPASGPGRFVEYDLDPAGEPVEVERPYGQNESAIVFGTVATPTARYPEGMKRVVLLGDPTKALGSLAEPECRRVMAALDMADRMQVPVEWFAVSSGAKIAMDSGTENMDWISRVLRRLVEFTQKGGEVNIVVTGINVGAQPYWNAEATMLMHTKGILIMTPDSAMVLTGKQSLEYSGGVAAEDNFGIGGYDRIMGPNGQAQYWAPDLEAACRLLQAHYLFSYVAPGDRFPRPLASDDPAGRDIRDRPHPGDFLRVGDIFSPELNPERKKPFDIRALMRAVIDSDVAPLERWQGMLDADTAVVFDASIGGHATTLIGIESKPVPRLGVPPTDGPDAWNGGTLFPLSSKKVARAINAASGSRPVVVLANLSGFDGSPESMRRLQLEYGAEIGRAIVNFDGPIVFCVVSRYHGGAFVVFSAVLNDHMEVAAVEGSFASVIGGGPAAAVVFTAEVRRRVEADDRVEQLRVRIREAEGDEAAPLRAELENARVAVQAEKQAEVAAEFDRIHSIERAREVGSVHTIIPAGGLRPYLVEALERGQDGMRT